jgi:hypothetical protein
VSNSLGLLLFSGACFVYLRYASDPSNLHVQERLQLARGLALFWSFTFYGSMLLCVLSLLGLGRSRWVGLVLNSGAFVYALMILGATCGPSGC